MHFITQNQKTHHDFYSPKNQKSESLKLKFNIMDFFTQNKKPHSKCLSPKNQKSE
jgi:hypothetical protein